MTESIPKFGEVGYEFNIKAKIVEVNPEDCGNFWPFRIVVDAGVVEEHDFEGRGTIDLTYATRQDLLSLVSKTAPDLAKLVKLEELEKAKAEVDRITKELAAIE
jgi:hypothetical protein